MQQALVSHAVNVSNQCHPDNAPAYKSAAQTLVLRLAFWDCAADPTIPEFMGSISITVNGPARPRTMTNPLYHYHFQNPAPSSWGANLSRYQETVRCAGYGHSVNNLTSANLEMMEVGSSLQSSVVSFSLSKKPLLLAESKQTGGYALSL